MIDEKVLAELKMTVQITGAEWEIATIRCALKDLSEWSDEAVIESLQRCRREVRGRLTLADIISRIDTGHPGPEEAWAIAKPAIMDESVTVVWTHEIAAAATAAIALVDDPIAARMAFLEAYRKHLPSAQPTWLVALGWDATARDGPIIDAVRLNRLPANKAISMLPHLRDCIDAKPALFQSKTNGHLEAKVET